MESIKRFIYTLCLMFGNCVAAFGYTQRNPLRVSAGSISNPSYRTLSWLCLFVQVKSPPSAGGTKRSRPLSDASLRGNLGSLEIASWCCCKDWPAEDDAESSGKPQQDGHGTRLSLERLHGLPKHSRLFSLVQKH